MPLQPIISIACLLFILLLSGCSDGSDSNGNTTAFDDCNLPARHIAISSTESGIEFVQTPEACFESFDGYDFEPHYAIVNGLRMHYVNAGADDGDVILMLHGQPSWSYLYRKVPSGWQFSTRILEADMELEASGLAEVVVDELRNTYQRAN